MGKSKIFTEGQCKKCGEPKVYEKMCCGKGTREINTCECNGKPVEKIPKKPCCDDCEQGG